MDEIQFIVSKLNEAPFSKKLRLVDFDEKSPIELLKLLNDIFVTMDPQMDVDLRDESDELRGIRMMNFLVMLRFQIPTEEQREAYRIGIMNGDKLVIYPIMHWLLQRHPQLQKRAYLARFLMPIEMPQEYMQDPALADLYTQYRAYQDEFKKTHKTVDQLRNSNLRPGELQKEISQLEEEKKQLNEKIGKLKRSNADDDGFDAMLKATSALRQEQEEESRLVEKRVEQRIALQNSEQRLSETQRRLRDLRKSTQTSGHSAEALFQQAQREVQELQKQSRSDLPREISVQQDKVKRLEQRQLEPERTREDVDEVQAKVREVEGGISQLRDQIAKVVSSRGDDKFSMYQSHAKVAAKKVAEKEETMDALQSDRDKLAREIEEQEAKLNAASGSEGTGAFMTKEERHQFAAELRRKAVDYKRMKSELSALNAESVVLSRTEQILKGRADNLEEFLAKLEARHGVSGYRATQEQLEKASEMTAAVDAAKGQTLDDISAVVRDITAQLKERKDKLAPEIHALKESRKAYQEVEQEYLRKKGTYDKVAVGLEVERQQLEQECDSFQEDCLQEESRYHFFQCLSSIAEVNWQRVQQEEKWQKGDGRLLPDFESYIALYKHKVSQQENLKKQLMRQRRSIEENEGSNTAQRKMFANLRQLLHCKMQCKQKQEKDREQMVGIGGSGANSISGIGDGLGTGLGSYGIGMGGGGAGGANVMKIDS